MNDVKDDINKKSGPSFYQLGLMALSDNVFSQSSISFKLKHLLLKLVKSTREGQPADSYLKLVLSLLLAISTSYTSSKMAFYEDYFEKRMLEEMCAAHSEKVAEWAGLSTKEYLENAYSVVCSERDHTQTYMPEISRLKMKDTLEDKLMNAPENDGLRGLLLRTNGGLIQLLSQISETDPLADRIPLSSIESIFKHAKCRPECISIVCDILRSQYEADAKKHTDNAELKGTTKASYIANLLQVKSKYEVVVREALKDEKLVKEQMDQVFPFIIKSLPADEVASSLAVHYNLLITQKGQSAGVKDSSLQAAICVLQHMTDKDIFENCHRKHMKRRLLMSDPTEDQMEAESTLLGFIKIHYDTTTLELMFQDYRRAILERGTWESVGIVLPLTFRPLVLNTNRWNQEPLGLILPPILQTCIDEFSKWYSSVHVSRKLNWVPIGTAEVSYRCGGRTYKLSLDSTPQLVYILQFETDSAVTAESIAAATRSPVEQVHRFLAPFASKAIGILNKSGESYSINSKFKPTKNVIKVPMGARAVASEDKSKTTSEIAMQRKAQTQAAIVRMMKSFKSLQHNDLTARVIDELQKRFKPDPKDIKKEIAFLIQENYLKRSEAAHDMYEYVA